MAHVKAAKITAKQGGNVIGKRRGIKIYGGGVVNVGSIIVRQLGTKYLPGKNVKLSKDFTIYSVANGVVKYTNATGKKQGKKIVNVVIATE